MKGEGRKDWPVLTSLVVGLQQPFPSFTLYRHFASKLYGGQERVPLS